MELAEIIGLRPVTCAGLLVSVTSRCPLACAHCSTASVLTGEQVDRGALLAFVGSFTPWDRPEVIMLTGGEPMLRPRLVTEVAELARAAGTRSAVLTGAFFARDGRLPAAVRRAVEAVDHCSVSLDAYHEREIPRRDVFTLLGRLLDAGVSVSLHIVGHGADDPYLETVTSDVVTAFGGQVPMLVSEVRALGRAAGWWSGPATASVAATAAATATAPAEPCALAAWPVIASDGTITACCNQDVVDGRRRAAHLRLGHIGTDSWGAVRNRSAGSGTLRMLRAVGPRHLGAGAGVGAGAGAGAGAGDGPAAPLTPAGYCAACQGLDQSGAEVARRVAFAAGPAGELLDREAGQIQARRGPVDFVRRYGCARHAELVALPGRREGG